MGLYDDKVFVTVLGNVDVITLGFDVGTELGSLDGSFDGPNYGKLEGLLLGVSPGYTDVKVLGSDEGFLFSFSFTHSLTLLVGFCGYGHVRCLLSSSKSILAKKYYSDRRCFY